MNTNGRNPRRLIDDILYSSLIIGLSYIFGAAIQFFFIPHATPNAPIAFRFLIGAGSLLTIKTLWAFGIMIARIISNRKHRKLASMMVMQTQEEFEAAGVETPLDFCYLMLTTSFETPLNIFNGSPARLRQLKDMNLYYKNVLLFKEMFGRNPIKADTFDWLTVSICEMYTRNNKVQPDLTFEDMKQMVSAHVLSLPTRFCQEWDYEIQRQFEDRCEALAEDLQRRRKNNGEQNV